MSSKDIEYKLDKIISDRKKDVNIVTSGDSKYPIYKYGRDELRYIRRELKNGLEILFIEDDLTVQSEVYMNVKVGHNHNPLEYPGLAHFLEHMLFIGSKAYPEPGYYGQLVAENHGYANAYTSDDHTLYYFGCRSDLLFNVIDVFCNFFVEPIFDPNYVEKEITAVDYEHQKNIGIDILRGWSLIDLFIKDEINSRFRTGDKTTLSKEGILDALKLFYTKYYTSDRMMLVIVHNSIDDKFISKIEEIFGQIPKRKSEIDIEEVYPVKIDKVDGYELIKAEKLGEGSDLMIRFFLPDTIKNRGVIDRSYHILSYILNHAGKQSLYKLLSDLDIAKSIFAGPGMVYTGDLGFDIVIALTDYGMSIYDHVVLIVLGYLNHIRQKYADVFDTYNDESYAIDVLNINTMSRISGSDAADSLIETYNSYKFDHRYIMIYGILEDVPTMKNHFKSMLGMMINNLNKQMKVILMSDKYSPDQFDKSDEYYGTKYSIEVQKINLDLMAKYYDLKFKLPELNPYIPDDLKVIVPIEGTQSSKSAKSNGSNRTEIGTTLEGIQQIDDPDEFIRLNSQRGNYYHLLKTNDYGTHYAYGSFTIRLSSMSDRLDPIDIILLELYKLLVIEAHQPDLFLSSIAGNTIIVNFGNRFMHLHFKSFDQELEMLLTKFLGWFYRDKLEIDRKAYQRFYTTMREGFLDNEKSEPYTRLHSILSESVDPENTVSNSQFLDAIQMFEPSLMENDDKNKISFNNLQEKAIRLISRGSIRGIMAGSIHLGTAQKVVKIIDSYYEHSREFRIRSIKNNVLNTGADDASYTERVFTKENKNTQDKNTGLLYAIHLGEYIRSEYDPDTDKAMNLREPLAYNLLSSVISDKFFNTMRTENELGYYVRAGISGIFNSGTVNMFLKFEIQTQEEDILNIVRKYVDSELLDIVHDFDESQVKKAVETQIRHMFKEYPGMSSKFRDAYSIQSDLTYDDLDKIGDGVYLNRLRSIDAYNELKKIDISSIRDLYEQAIRSRPRYVVMITPSPGSE